MTFSPLRYGILATTCIGLLVVACASTPEQEEKMPTSGATPAPGDNFGEGTPKGDAGPLPSTEACATSTSVAGETKLHLVIMLDQSDSMCVVPNSEGDSCAAPTSRWQQVIGALKSFFVSAESKGIVISLFTFPMPNADGCDLGTYANPLAAEITLPDTTNTLRKVLDKIQPDGTTPTRPGLQGAITYAGALQKKYTGQVKTAVLLATDGLPTGCTANAISDSVNLASSSAASIPTYVLGVGNELSALNAIAVGGGTSAAHLVSGSGAQAGADIAKALAAIRTDVQLACDYALPSPPAGQALDPMRVNVLFTPGGGKAQALTYDPSCAKATGWRYDDPNKPTRISLCASSCATAKADGAAKVDLVLGCKTNEPVLK